MRQPKKKEKKELPMHMNKKKKQSKEIVPEGAQRCKIKTLNKLLNR